ncbi:hypothetical protein H4R35_006718 [Dimargaris xerosporica]|nr:hypothetical protein H4R35_006718 [Dimargaris xerosporica]
MGPEPADQVKLPNWVGQMGLGTVSDVQQGQIEKARMFAENITPILLHCLESGEPTPELPPTLFNGNQLLATGVDPVTMENIASIYIGSISFDLTEDHIRAIFTQFGAIKTMAMSIDPAVGHHKGYCFLTYEMPEAGNLAIDTMNGALLGGRTLRVGRSNHYNPSLLAKIPQAPPTRLYVANVNEYINEENLSTIFQAFGGLKECILIPDVTTRRHKGYGYVEFEDPETTNMAVSAMNGFDLGGAPLRVHRAIMGGALPQGMSVLDKLADIPVVETAVSAKTTPAVQAPPVILRPAAGHAGANSGPTGVNTQPVGSAPGSMAGQPAASTVTFSSAADAVASGGDSVAKEENVSIDSQQRYSLMQKLAQRGVSTVVCITNAVGLEDVDDELQDEFAEECAKYGQIVKVTVHTDAAAPPESQVKIFIQFTDATGSQNALASLNGRWFGGRQLHVKLYDQELFHANDYSG